MKAAHEVAFLGRVIPTSEAIVRAMRAELELYWLRVARANTAEHALPELAIRVDIASNNTDLIDSALSLVDRLDEVRSYLLGSSKELEGEARSFFTRIGVTDADYASVPYYENPFINRDWEMLALGMANLSRLLRTALLQVRLRELEEALSRDTSNAALTAEVDTLRAEFLEYAKNISYSD
jgi:hypothetical protein